MLIISASFIFFSYIIAFVNCLSSHLLTDGGEREKSKRSIRSGKRNVGREENIEESKKIVRIVCCGVAYVYFVFPNKTKH